jgi:hypothetical protein
MLRVLLLTSAVVATTFLNGTTVQTGDDQREPRGQRLAKSGQVPGESQESWPFWSHTFDKLFQRPAPGQVNGIMVIVGTGIQDNHRVVNPLIRIRTRDDQRPLIHIRRLPDNGNALSRRYVSRRTR